MTHSLFQAAVWPVLVERFVTNADPSRLLSGSVSFRSSAYACRRIDVEVSIPSVVKNSSVNRFAARTMSWTLPSCSRAHCTRDLRSRNSTSTGMWCIYGNSSGLNHWPHDVSCSSTTDGPNSCRVSRSAHKAIISAYMMYLNKW